MNESYKLHPFAVVRSEIHRKVMLPAVEVAVPIIVGIKTVILIIGNLVKSMQLQPCSHRQIAF